MLDKLFKVYINIVPALRGCVKMCFCKVFRREIYFGQLTRIKRNVEWKFYPGCKYSSGRGFLVGRDVTISVSRGANLYIGENVGIGNRCQIVCHDCICIGDGTIIAPNVMIYDHNHLFDEENGVRQREFECAKVSIGKNCWLGAGCIILEGVTIGDNCVIGAGSVVTKDIPSGSVAVGSPARVVNKGK